MNSLRSYSRQEIHVKAALVILALLACAPSAILHAQSFKTSIVFFAEPQVSQGFWPVLFESLREDLASGSAESPEVTLLDPRPALLRGQELYTGIQFSVIVQVRLQGRCDVLPQADHHLRPGPLGWVLQISGVIQPFIFVDCTRLAQVLGPAVMRLSNEGRQHAMAQAIAHVLIHEWIHIVTQSDSHRPHGITRASLSVEELTASPPNRSLLLGDE
jgi:hypothetical protein